MRHGARGARSDVRATPASASRTATRAELEPPSSEHAAVPRPRLIARLIESRMPVVSVTAPPGYGKTTVLRQWEAADPRPFAWISLESEDNDPSVLASHISTSVRAGPRGPGVIDTERPDEDRGSPSPSLSSVARSVRALDPCVVVFDDLHHVERSVALDVISTLIASATEGSTIVLSSRRRPPFPVARMRAQRRILEIDAGDLTFDVHETEELLHRQAIDVSAATIETLHRRTEGWPVAVYLAALSLKAGGPSGALNPHRMEEEIVDYQRLELLDRLPKREVSFLIRTAVLDRLCGALCDAVLGTTGSAAMLESLERSNMLLVPLDGRHQWYRYHHMFRELLRSDLDLREAKKVPELLRRAAAWSEENADAQAAIRYAQAAGDDAHVARLVALHAQPFFARGHGDTVQMWFDWLLEHSSVERYGHAAALGVWLNAMRGHPVQAERWAAVLDAAVIDGAATDGSESLEPWRAMSAAMLCRDGAAEMRRDADAALRTVAPASPYRPQALVLAGLSRILAGETDAADETFGEAVELGESIGAANAAVLGLSERALIALQRGDFGAASEFSERAGALRDRTGLAGYSTSGLSFAVAAHIAVHEGKHHAGTTALTAAHRLRPILTFALPHVSVQTLLEMIRAEMASADGGAARTLLREVDLVLRHRPDLGDLAEQRNELRTQVETIQSTAPGVSTLTTAELRLLPFLPSHLSFREIAERLGVSPHTVKTQAIAVYRKLDVSSRSDAVTRAVASGLLEA
jgi:LuxR family maltose regulon positive regulatory protein